MNDGSASAVSLEKLCERSLAGDRAAETALFENLRVRFLSLAKRRVQKDHAEDVVQDALQIILTKYRERGAGGGILVWGLTVLRNVIGNYYQARQRETGRLDYVENPQDLADLVAVEPVADENVVQQQLLSAIEILARKFPRCGAIFHGILSSLEKGGSPHRISQGALAAAQKQYPKLTRNSFYVALHRCRANLRCILDEMEGGNCHG